jgi:hypothetical protein
MIGVYAAIISAVSASILRQAARDSRPSDDFKGLGFGLGAAD